MRDLFARSVVTPVVWFVLVPGTVIGGAVDLLGVLGQVVPDQIRQVTQVFVWDLTSNDVTAIGVQRLASKKLTVR